MSYFACLVAAFQVTHNSVFNFRFKEQYWKHQRSYVLGYNQLLYAHVKFLKRGFFITMIINSFYIKY